MAFLSFIGNTVNKSTGYRVTNQYCFVLFFADTNSPPIWISCIIIKYNHNTSNIKRLINVAMKRETTRRHKGNDLAMSRLRERYADRNRSKVRRMEYIPHTVQTSNTTPATADNGKVKVKI